MSSRGDSYVTEQCSHWSPRAPCGKRNDQGWRLGLRQAPHEPRSGILGKCPRRSGPRGTGRPSRSRAACSRAPRASRSGRASGRCPARSWGGAEVRLQGGWAGLGARTRSAAGWKYVQSGQSRSGTTRTPRRAACGLRRRKVSPRPRPSSLAAHTCRKAPAVQRSPSQP